MVYDKRSATFYCNKISLSTVSGRIECDFELPAGSPTPYEEYVLSEDYEFRTSTLQYDQATDEFHFHVKTRKVDIDSETVEIGVSDDTQHQTVPGIDLGVNSLAVASTALSGVVTSTTTGYRSLRSAEQRCNSAGTQSAHNALLRLGKRERAWRKQYIHTVANEIVDEAVTHDCDVIVSRS